MEFIGRKKEVEILENQYSNIEHPFIIIKGRRRVGKSRLIKEFCHNKDALYFQSDKEDGYAILQSFCKKLSEYCRTDISGIDSWQSAISLFVKLSGPGRRILVIDEFQYITKADKNAEKEFQSIWDNILSQNDVMFIISGSYKTMMDDLTNYDKPLYGRNTCDLLIRPLAFRDCIRDSDYRYAVEEYAFTGGVPHYISLFNHERSVMENMISLTMNVGGPLINEVPYLMGEEFKDTKSYNTYLKAIASGHRKMDSICSSLQVRSNEVSPYLNKLIGSLILERRVPVTESAPEKNRNGLYTISDKFIAYWFRYVYPYRNDIILDMNEEAVMNLEGHYIDNHVSFVFEDICKSELRRYLLERRVAASYGTYWDRNVEIDVVAKDERNKTIYVGECKYHNSEIDSDVLHRLMSKCDRITAFRDYRLVYCVFSVSGFSERMMMESNRKDVILFDCGDPIQ